MSMFKLVPYALCVLMLARMLQGQEASAQTFKVGQLDKHCRSYLKLIRRSGKAKLTKNQAVDVVKCTSYIAAFHYGKTIANIENDTFGPYCLPKRLHTTNWLVKNFVRWVAAHPRQTNKVAGIGLLRSLQERYGCDERDRLDKRDRDKK